MRCQTISGNPPSPYWYQFILLGGGGGEERHCGHKVSCPGAQHYDPDRAQTKSPGLQPSSQCIYFAECDFLFSYC